MHNRMPNVEDIKKYIFSNKKIVILAVVLLACLCAYSVAALVAPRKTPENVQTVERNENTREFVVYDYNEQKLKYSEALDKKQLEEMAVSNPEDEIDENTMDSILSHLPSGSDTITMNVRTAGRSNPFAPYVERSLSGGGTFDIVEPPQYIPDDNQAQDLMQTTVSGILYNEQKSSAIINVDGTDQLVNKGDKIAGFQIVNITRNKVYVKKGYNVIAAGVGETIEEPALTYNSVYNLPNKFGGKYTKTPQKSVIMINGESN